MIGERILRIEAAGPTPVSVLRWLSEQPPADLAGHQVLRVEYNDEVVLGLAAATVTVRALDNPKALALTAEHQGDTSEAEQRLDLARILDELGGLVADPERAQAAAATAARTTPAAGDIDHRAGNLFDSVPKLIDHAAALRLIVSSIDLTTLAGDDTTGRVRALCAQARTPDPTDPTLGSTAAVCVYPSLVAAAVELCAGSSVAVASVAGAFPSGLSSLAVRLADIADAVTAGADEVDVVLNRSAFLAGETDVAHHELQAMRTQMGSRVMKVILETGELGTPQAIHEAALLAMSAGADWIKTSTGKSGVGATPVAVLAMAEAVAEHVGQGGGAVGIKISGGVRTSEQALGYLSILEATLGAAWLDASRVRFGASGLLGAVVADLQRGPKIPGGA